MFENDDNRSNRQKGKGFDRFLLSGEEKRQFFMFESDEILDKGISAPIKYHIN